MLEDYFDFLSPDDIRLKGSRIGIETVLYEYIYRSQPPEAIRQMFPSLTLEQVYATILYYLRNRSLVDIYLANWLEFSREIREEQRRNPSPAVIRLLQIRKEIAASGLTVEQYLRHKASQENELGRLVAPA